jgi:hypothetical protein
MTGNNPEVTGSNADHLRFHLEASRRALEELIRRGLRIRHAQDGGVAQADVAAPPVVAADPSALVSRAIVEAWQRDCASLISQLSGGAKSHWLARAYSGAFLVRPDPARVALEAAESEIIDRILEVLRRAAGSLAGMDDLDASAGSPPVASRFEFVHDAGLRPVLERALTDSERAFRAGEFTSAFVTSCAILEAIITDALQAHARRMQPGCGGSNGDGSPWNDQSIGVWSFAARIAAAEASGLIRRGCDRLPSAAREYRELSSADGRPAADVVVSERDARVAGQVLRVIMRDLNPGR